MRNWWNQDSEEMPAVQAVSEACIYNDVRDVLKLIRSVKMRIDPALQTECKRLFSNPGTRINYYSPEGLTVDGIGEALLDAGFVSRSLTECEVLEFLEKVFTPQPHRLGRRRPAKSEINREVRKAKSNREKKFQCPECQQIARGARNTSLICGICYEIDGKIVVMRRVERTAEEVLEMLVASASESQTA